MHIYSIFYPHIWFFPHDFILSIQSIFLEFLKCHQLYKRTLIFFMHPFSQWWNLMKIFLLQVGLIFCIFLALKFFCFHCLILINWMASENKACKKNLFRSLFWWEPKSTQKRSILSICASFTATRNSEFSEGFGKWVSLPR